MQAKHLRLEMGGRGPMSLRDLTQIEMSKNMSSEYLGIDVVNELRSVQHSYRQLRTQVASVASYTDVSELAARQAALTTRLERIEAGFSTVMQDQDHAAETAREYQAKVDTRLARVERVNDRIRAQDWHHDLSEQESDEEIEQMLESAQRRCTQEQPGTQRIRVETSDIDQWHDQLRQEFQHHVRDRNNLAPRGAQFLEEHQRREERRSTVEQQFNHFRNEYAKA